MISKKFTFVNVANQATFLGNIKTVVDSGYCGSEYGWTIDSYTSGDDGTLMLHSNGVHGLQNLYYSIKLNNPTDGCSHIHLCGQTGYNAGSAYDAQDGKFTYEPHGFPSAWNGVSNYNTLATFVTSPIEKQVILVNKQFIAVFWRNDVSLYAIGTAYPLWNRIIIGAMGSLYPEAELFLNYVDESVWSKFGWISSPFMGGYKYYSYVDGYIGSYPRPTTGLLFKQPFDSFASNKDHNPNTSDWGISSSPRWYSTINYRDAYHFYRSYSSSSSGVVYQYGGWPYSDWRLGGSYTDGTRFNVSVIKHFMHRPVVFLYEWIDAENIFHYPIGYLPFNAVRTGNNLAGDDTISFGTRNFAVFPTQRDGSVFGMAFEYIEGL